VIQNLDSFKKDNIYLNLTQKCNTTFKVIFVDKKILLNA